VLSRLIDEVRQRDSIAAVATLVSARVDSVLHPSSLHIFYRAEERSDRFDGQSSSDSRGARLPPSRPSSGAEFSAKAALLRLLEADTAIRDVPGGVRGGGALSSRATA
jgi:hypothetical protein